MQKKTLIITFEYPPTVGGIATYVHDLANAMDPEKTIVLAPKHKKSLEWDASVNYYVIRKNFLWPKFIWPRWTRLSLQVRSLVKKYGIEKIMVHHVLPGGYPAVWMKKQKPSVPFVLFSHGTDLVAGTATKWKRKMVTKVSSHADQIIFNSESLKHRYLQILPQFEDKAEVVYPCPRTDLLEAPARIHTDDLRKQLALQGKVVMLSVGRITEGKGFTHLARLMPEIVKAVPHIAWVVVGDGPKHDAVAKLVQKTGLSSIVRFVGEVPHSELKQYYYLADLFTVLTHPDEGREEGLGLVFLEAAAAGLPIIAGKSGGVEEAVLHTQTGLVIDLYKGDKQIVEAIKEMATNTEYAQRLGKAAKARIRDNFVWEHQVGRLNEWLSK